MELRQLGKDRPGVSVVGPGAFHWAVPWAVWASRSLSARCAPRSHDLVERTRSTAAGASSVPGELVAAMPPKRQTLFRDVWAARGRPDKNLYYDEENFAA